MGSEKPLSRSQASQQIEKRNNKLKETYKGDHNYIVVESPDFPNGAFYAVDKRHNDVPHEKTVAEIVAKNGMCMALDAEGKLKMMDNTGKFVQAKSLDGKFMDLTQEIMALKGRTNVSKVADAIAHSFKQNKVSNVQAEVAISFTPKGSQYKTEHIQAGVKEFVRRANNTETKARPLIYIHVDETTEKMYLHKIKGKI